LSWTQTHVSALDYLLIPLTFTPSHFLTFTRYYGFAARLLIR